MRISDWSSDVCSSDLLSHWGQLFDGIGDGVARKTYYNGYRADEHIAADGEDGPCAHALGIENLAETSVQGRAVLVDLLAAEGPERNWIGYDRLRRAMDTQSRSEEHKSELKSLMRISYAGIC